MGSSYYLSIALKRHIQSRHLVAPVLSLSQQKATTDLLLPESTNEISSPARSAPRLRIKPMSELKASLAAAGVQIHQFLHQDNDEDHTDTSRSSTPLRRGQAVVENGTSDPLEGSSTREDENNVTRSGSSFKVVLDRLPQGSFQAVSPSGVQSKNALWLYFSLVKGDDSRLVECNACQVGCSQKSNLYIKKIVW